VVRSQAPGVCLLGNGAPGFSNGDSFRSWDDNGHPRSGGFAPDVDPVASAEGDRPHGVLRKVVAELQFGIIEEAGQLYPNSKSVSAGLAGSTTGQSRLAHLDDMSEDFSERLVQHVRWASHPCEYPE